MKKVIFMGKTGSGKTTLCQKLHEIDVQYKKTQSIELYDYAIDTPGEYIENRHYYSALIVTSADADVIALVEDSTAEEGYFPPAFANMFCKPVIGIVTKIGKVDHNQAIEYSKLRLQSAGVQQIFLMDTVEGIGVEQLVNYLKSLE